MRVWDVNPGYLNRQSLLAEHREIHGVYVVITAAKKGYSRHPETLRWYGKLAALKKRHDLQGFLTVPVFMLIGKCQPLIFYFFD